MVCCLSAHQRLGRLLVARFRLSRRQLSWMVCSFAVARGDKTQAFVGDVKW